MKLKFRATGKDLVIFFVFALVLLYLVAIAVLNIANFADTGNFYGFNAIEAFSPEYLAATIVGYVLALVLIITSVSSYFFEREKGLGVTTANKKEKGYSNWSSDKEMKQALSLIKTKETTSNVAGMPIINDGQNIYVDDGEYHSLIIGSTGSGKTQTMVLPLVESLAKKGESMIVTDPKGEIYEKTANMLKSRGYNVVLLNFRDTLKGNSWNPLNLPYSLYQEGNKDKSNELLDDLAMNILYDDKAQSQDPFWEKTSADYFTGLSLSLFEDAKKEEINLNSINLMSTVGEEKVANTTYINDYYAGKDPGSPAYINVSSTIMAPKDTKSSILSVFKQKIKLFSSRENLSEMLSYSDFDMKDIGRKKTAVFIVIQDEKKTYHSLVTIFIKQVYETLIDVAQESGGKLAFRTNFILDEFANMPPLKDVTTMVTAARSRNIRFNFIIQNFAQLYQVYGKENGETIKGNCGNIIYLISSELGALEEISKMCGEVKSKDKDKTASTPLVTVSDLQRLSPGEIIVLRTRMMPYKTKVVYDHAIDWGYKREVAGYPIRERKAVALFDLKGYVNAKREQKMNDLIGGMSASNDKASPFGNSAKSTPSLFDQTDPFKEKTSPLKNDFPFLPPSLGAKTDEKEFPFIPPVIGNSADNKEMPTSLGSMEDKKSFNIDDLVKRIDARIAELEAEEAKESTSIPAIPITKEQVKKDTNIPVKPVIEEKIKKDVELSVNNSKTNEVKISDDQFFDDFFNDDEY